MANRARGGRRSCYNAEDAFRILMEDIDSDEEDFEELEIAGVEVEEQSNSSDQEEDNSDVENPPSHLQGNDGTIWRPESRASSTGRTARKNIVQNPGGAKRFILARANNPIDVFFELWGPTTFADICEKTIQEARLQRDKDFSMSVEELKAFLGLSIIRGVLKGRSEPLSSFWSDNYGRRIFGQTMSRQKYKDILRYIRFDDKQTRHRRKSDDKYAPIRELWQKVMDNAQKCFYPYGHVTIDEQLFPCRSRCSFIQYMPNKPSKFGIKFWLLCDSKTSYILQAFPYVGKEDNRVGLGLGEHVVCTLMEPYRKSGLNVTTDNFFTSLRVARHLLKDDMTIVGTLRQNRREVPSELKQKDVSLYSSRVLFSDDDIMLLSYKAKKDKVVLLLSSMHRSASVSENDPKRKPEPILFYNSTKGGVDTADEMLRGYSTKSATRRWPLAVFFNLIDIVALNTFVICSDSGITRKRRRDFLISLGEELCNASATEVSRGMMPSSSGDDVDKGMCRTSLKRTTCRQCQTNKTRSTCKKCSKFICGTCANTVCDSCFEN